MGGKKVFVAALSLCLAAVAYDAHGGSLRRSGETTTLKGSIAVVGNAPFTYVVLAVPPSEGSGRPVDHAVQGPLAEDLRRYQGRTVTLECRRCEGGPNQLPCIEPTRILGVE